MYRIVFILVTIAVVLGSAPPAGAAAPPVIPVQGVLTDKNKMPIDATVDIRFSIHDDETAGTELWSETQTVPVNNGLFTTHLGQTNALDLLIFKNNDDLWLGIKVGQDEEMPRIYLGSTPFAGYAEHSGGGTLADLSCADGEVAQKVAGAWACAPLPDGRRFVTWGSQSCQAPYQTLYSGFLLHSGGGAHHAGDSVCAEGAQRQVYRFYGAYQWEAPLYCAVCAHPNAKVCFNHWGAASCPAGYSTMYTGNMYSAGQNDGYGGRWLCASDNVQQGQNYEQPLTGEGSRAWYTARPCAVCCSE
jgi:hypothetical protein